MGNEGKSQPLIPRTKWAGLYLACTILFSFTIIALECVIFAWFQQAGNAHGQGTCTASSIQCTPAEILAQTMPIYLALFLFAGVYQILISIWALNQRNTIQLLFLVFFSMAMLVYSGIQFDQIRDNTEVTEHLFISAQQVDNILIAVPCILGAWFLIQGFFTYKLYKEFNWDIFRGLGAGLRLKQALRDYLFFESLIIFDIFFFVGFTLQFIVVVLQTKDVEFALTIAVIPITIIILVGAIFSVRREFKAGLIGFIILCFPGMAYFLYKLIRLYTAKVGSAKRIRFDRAKKTLTVFAAITLVFLVLTIVYAIKAFMNFGLGLKDRNKDKSQVVYLDTEQGLDMVPLESENAKEYQGNRMVID